MRHTKKIFFFLLTALLSVPSFVDAAANSSTDKSGDYNMVLISLVSLMLILLFIIGMLANTMRQLSVVVRDKNRTEKKEQPAVAKAVLLLLSLTIPALHAFAADAPAKADKVVAPVSNFINGIPKDQFYVIMAVIALELIVIFALVFYIKVFIRIINAKPELSPAEKAVVAKRSWFWDKFNAAASIEREKDILLDHNYDGIQELDNSLPPWWKYGFYLTIVVAVIYIYRFHISHDGPSSHEEFVAAMQKAEEDKTAYLAAAGNNVDENTVTLLTDATEIAAGKEIFLKTCAPCHLADGGGVVGPNLTDDYWLHGGGIKDVFKSIKYGWQDKGMKSWKDDFSPKQIQQLASFVKSLKGTKPAVAKAPQGDLYIEAGPAGNSADSTNRKTDTTGKGKVVIK
jgi:cytochrome c oxidase cbb3-type subunit III